MSPPTKPLLPLGKLICLPGWLALGPCHVTGISSIFFFLSPHSLRPSLSLALMSLCVSLFLAAHVSFYLCVVFCCRRRRCCMLHWVPLCSARSSLVVSDQPHGQERLFFQFSFFAFLFSFSSLSHTATPPPCAWASSLYVLFARSNFYTRCLSVLVTLFPVSLHVALLLSKCSQAHVNTVCVCGGDFLCRVARSLLYLCCDNSCKQLMSGRAAQQLNRSRYGMWQREEGKKKWWE